MLDDATIDIVGVTGTMNGAVLVDVLLRSGPRQTRTELRRYWEAVGAKPGFDSLYYSAFMRFLTRVGHVQASHGRMPRDMQLTYSRAALRTLDNAHMETRARYLAHGRWYPKHGTAELRRAFRNVARDPR